jgi:hypothetical protein
LLEQTAEKALYAYAKKRHGSRGEKAFAKKIVFRTFSQAGAANRSPSCKSMRPCLNQQVFQQPAGCSIFCFD